MDPQIRFCTTSDDVSIAYFARGRGMAFVVVPNMYSNIANEAGDDFALQAGVRIVTYDGRGMGSSTRDVEDFSLSARVRDLDAVVRATDLHHFVLWGDKGTACSVAIQFAHDRPDLVSHLVLNMPVVDGEASYRAGASLGGLEAMRASDAHWETYLLTATNIEARFENLEFAQEIASRKLAAMTPEAVRQWVAATRLINVTALLGKISAPTLVMVCSCDKCAVNRTEAQLVAAGIASAMYTEIPPGEDNGDKMLAAVAQFVGQRGRIPKLDGRSVFAMTLAPASRTFESAPAARFRTVLFTDLVGHTEMMQRLGDAKGRDVLREHERITRETLKQHSGAEIKTMGDGFMASFGSVTAAMECAIALQRAFAAWNDRAGGAEGPLLQVRAGLNAGEPIEEDGDLFGATVIMASRVAAQADAGEILIPETVRGLLSGKGFTFAERGEFVPKGFEDAVRLFEVRWRD